jgi:prolyl-tRNA synthetase
VAEANRDEKGIVWPVELAPFQVHLLLLERDESLADVANVIYEELQAAKVDVLFDDRNERPGAKFADADLFGIPVQIVVGKTTRETGEVEIRLRKNKTSELAPAAEAYERALQALAELEG